MVTWHMRTRPSSNDCYYAKAPKLSILAERVECGIRCYSNAGPIMKMQTVLAGVITIITISGLPSKAIDGSHSRTQKKLSHSASSTHRLRLSSGKHPGFKRIRTYSPYTVKPQLERDYNSVPKFLHNKTTRLNGFDSAIRFKSHE
jgi:hypothetical protein